MVLSLGILVPPLPDRRYPAEKGLEASEKDLASGLIDLLSDSAYRRGCARAALSRADDFAVDRITAQWLNLIEEVLQHGA